MKKVFLIFTMLMMFCTSCFASAYINNDEVVDWEKGTITLEVAGAPSSRATTKGQKKLQARRAAIMNGMRELLENVNGININGNTTVQDMAFESETTSGMIQGTIRHAMVVAERYDEEDALYYVTLKLPLYGSVNSVSSAVMKPVQKEAFPNPSDNTSSNAYNTPSISSGYNYTGLVVDCRGMNLKPVMSPVIKDTKGTPIYGYKNLDYNKVVEKGMVGYSSDINSYSRAGSNPLVVKAVSLENFNAYPILTEEDANKVLRENQTSHFLDNTNVVFIR